MFQYSHAVFAVVPNLLRYPVGRMFVFPLMCRPLFFGSRICSSTWLSCRWLGYRSSTTKIIIEMDASILRRLSRTPLLFEKRKPRFRIGHVRRCLSQPSAHDQATKPEPGHKIYPYLLCGMEITRPNQVWAMDITYVPMDRLRRCKKTCSTTVSASFSQSKPLL